MLTEDARGNTYMPTHEQLHVGTLRAMGLYKEITGSIEANIHCDEKLVPSDIDCHKSAGNKRQKQARAAWKLENIALQHINLHLLPSVAHSSQAPSPLLGQQSILVLQLG